MTVSTQTQLSIHQRNQLENKYSFYKIILYQISQYKTSQLDKDDTSKENKANELETIIKKENKLKIKGV